MEGRRCRSITRWLLLLLATAGAVAEEVDNSKDIRFPTVLVVHGGFRPTMLTDVTMYKLSVTSWLYSFFGQFDKTPRKPLEALLWVDTSSYEEHLDVLEGVLHNLRALIVEINADYPWVKFSVRFSRGIAETYHRSLSTCQELPWCHYMMFTEDDWMFEHVNIKHSALELYDIMQDHDWVNYIRFNKRTLQAILFDAPCLVEDTRLPIPLTHTGGFSNNAHLCRVSAIQKLFDITHDARQAAHTWGVECHSDMGKIGMFALCHNLAYACAAQRPFVQDPAVCDYNKYVQSHGCGDTKWATESYRQIDAKTCRNDQDKSPRYDHCGLYLYGSFEGAQSASHLQGEGESFDPTEFWANPVSRLTGNTLPYIKQSPQAGSGTSFMSRLKHIMFRRPSN
ncbi:hypothetical protein MMC14_010456 [Varicellaria rhodocarpa]|nr:hypothetical protein [Varicellaria rhodocarpa]